MKKIGVIILILVLFLTGFYIGRISVPRVVVPISIAYPIIYTVYSKINAFDGYTGAQLDILLAGSKLAGLGKYFSFYAWQNNVNSIYLLSHAILESAWGASYLAQDRFNLFGFSAFDEDPNRARRFDSYEDCIATVTAYIAKEYLTPGGLWYVAPNLRGMNTHYASSTSWATNIVNIMNMLRYKIGEADMQNGNVENWYIQNFGNFNSFNLPLSKGQVIRDLAMIYHISGYKSAGEWAEINGIVTIKNNWWNSSISRTELKDYFAKAFNIGNPYKTYNLNLLELPDTETYQKWYCLALYKYVKEVNYP